MRQRLRKFLDDPRGATSIEYGVIGVVISITIYAATKAIGTKLSSVYMQPLVGNM